MKKVSVLAAFVLVLFFLLTGSAGAVTIDEVGNPGSQYWDDSAQAIAAKAQNGQLDYSGSVLVSQLVMGTTDLTTPGHAL